MDCYNSFQDLLDAFTKFASSSKKTITSHTCKNSRQLQHDVSTTDQPDIVIEHSPGRYAFTHNGLHIKLTIPGKHNVENAILAITVAKHYKIPNRDIIYALENFQGISRRFEKLGTYKTTDIIIDYAHHPIEIATTIKTAKSLYMNFLIIFQPHTYTRTNSLFSDFTKVFKSLNTKDTSSISNEVIFFKTYAAREKIIPGATAKDLASSLNKKHFFTDSTLLKYIEKMTPKYDAIIFTGAGNIDLVARKLK